MADQNRFQDLNDDDIDKFLSDQKNKNTTKKTASDIKLFRSFLDKEGLENTQIEEIESNRLNDLLTKFVITVKKKDGEEYEPSTIQSQVSSIRRYLNERYYGVDMLTDPAFQKYRKALSAKKKYLKSLGKGSMPNRAEPLSEDEIESLWDNNQLGTATPNSILNTMWLYTGMGFGLRGSDEHRKMCWGDVKLKIDGDGTEYLEFMERQTKTRQGDNSDIRAVTPKLWENTENKDRCPIQVYKFYKEKRPSDYSKPDHPFYIAASTNWSPGHQIWFMRQQVGERKLGSIMKMMAKTLNTEKRLTNHTSRKTLIQRLTDRNVPPTDIIQLTGQKDIQSVTNYSNLKEPAHKRLSSFLYCPSAKKSKPSATATSTASQQVSATVRDQTPTIATATSATVPSSEQHSTVAAAAFPAPSSPPVTVKPATSATSGMTGSIVTQAGQTSAPTTTPFFNFPQFNSPSSAQEFVQNMFNGFIQGGTGNHINVQINLNMK